jgi:hypothetical protein
MPGSAAAPLAVHTSLSLSPLTGFLQKNNSQIHKMQSNNI